MASRETNSKIAEDKTEFLIFCIELYKAAHGKTGAEVFDMMESTGMSSFILDCYSVLHTQGENFLLDNMDEYLQARGYKKSGRLKSGVSKNEFFPLLSCIVMNVVKFITEQEGCTFDDAVKRVYHSQMYTILEQEKTKFWHLGPAQLYEELLDDKPEDSEA